MNVEIKPFRALPCSLQVFQINGKGADILDFGEGYDHNISDAEPYCCGDWRFDTKKPTKEILAKYSISKGEYYEICSELQEKLNVGSCGWCS